jgi:formylglycine-generating enzyme required for sulfatase activity
MMTKVSYILLFLFLLIINVNVGFCVDKIPPGMVLVKGGTFFMGSSGGRPYDEEPIHTVTLRSFHMGKFEITREEWKAAMGTNPSLFKGDDHPVENVNWYDAIQYCNKRSEMEGLTPCYSGKGDDITCNFDADGCRLPTEAEWEYACRGGTRSGNYQYSGSNNAAEVAWYEINSGFKPHAVGQKKPNELGIYDMSGNLWEWCWEWYDKDYYKNSVSDNPRGPLSGKERSYRGGGCCGRKQFLRSTARYTLHPTFKRFDMGFRVVKKASGKLPAHMVLVEGGRFKMGSNDGGNGEKTVHRVKVSSFFIGKSEVTQEEWYAVMGYNPSVFLGARCPLGGISWNDAIQYCNKKSQIEGLTPCYTISADKVTCNFAADGCRLPSEAEWEYACGGGEKSGNYKFSGSHTAEEVGWYNKNAGFLLQPVMQKKPNELGIYDMSGNVMEWCWDWYDKDYYKTGPLINPQGPLSGIRRVVRGGSLYDSENALQATNRQCFRPFRAITNVGFRLVRTAGDR